MAPNYLCSSLAFLRGKYHLYSNEQNTVSNYFTVS